MIKQITNQKTKKTRKKLVTQWINAPLIGLHSDIKRYYERAYHCSSVLYQVGNTISTKYCNCRTCVTCNSIRTAAYIKSYGDQIFEFKEPQFVTLTAPTVQCFDVETLKHYIEAREYNWRKIYKNASSDRKGLIKLRGLKAMEITTRPDDYYHIHFHFIVEGKDTANWLKGQWLSHYKDALERLQVIKPLISKEGLLEVFKYGTKFVNKEKILIDGKQTSGYKKIEPERVDLIIQALQKKRLISTFGGIRKVKDENVNDIVEEMPMLELAEVEHETWSWINNVDWFAESTGEKFSDFVPSIELKKVFSKDILN